MCLIIICSKEGCFNVESIGAEGKVVSMDKFEEIQQFTQQLHVHGGPKDVNDSSSDKDNDEEEDSECIIFGTKIPAKALYTIMIMHTR